PTLFRSAHALEAVHVTQVVAGVDHQVGFVDRERADEVLLHPLPRRHMHVAEVQDRDGPRIRFEHRKGLVAHREAVALHDHAPRKRGKARGRRHAQRAGDRAPRVRHGQLFFRTVNVTWLFLLTTEPAAGFCATTLLSVPGEWFAGGSGSNTSQVWVTLAKPADCSWFFASL